METEIKLPTLFGLASTGKIKQWDITARDGEIETSHGVEGGKQTVKVRPVEGKNIGKKNETSPYEQARKEALSKWKRKFDKGYREDVEDLSSVPLRPMKLQVYEDHKDKIVYPAMVQPKLNGIKCVVEKVDSNTITYTSNGGKPYTTLSHLDKELLDSLQVGDIKDGEIYLHGTPLQGISAAVKKVKELTPSLQYWMYDVVNTTLDNATRNALIVDYLEDNPEGKDDHIVGVWGKLVENEDEYDVYHNSLVADGYEGTVIRNLSGMYRPGYRSYDAQKRKDFKDEEFEIVGATKDVDGCVIWTCDAGNGKQFNVVPKGDKNSRKFYYDDREDYFGKMLTVKFLEKSEDGTPQGNGVGVCIRDYE